MDSARCRLNLTSLFPCNVNLLVMWQLPCRSGFFSFIRLPSILQSDNGREFVNKLIEEVLSSWPGQVQLVSGRPRHPQSQGLVEQAHYTMERMISAKVVESKLKCPPWADWLPHIICKHLYISYIPKI